MSCNLHMHATQAFNMLHMLHKLSICCTCYTSFLYAAHATQAFYMLHNYREYLPAISGEFCFKMFLTDFVDDGEARLDSGASPDLYSWSGIVMRRGVMCWNVSHTYRQYPG